MTVKLHQAGFDHARRCINDGQYVIDGRDAWSEHQPKAADENAFIERHGWGAYGQWHLGIDDEVDEDKKSHWKFPYGDFKKVHMCGVLAAESRSGQRKYFDIELATAHIHGMLEALENARSSGRRRSRQASISASENEKVSPRAR
jgi:hypothetical protein